MKIGIMGLGYVGLPLACLLSEHFEIVGYDCDASRIEELSRGVDRNGEYSQKDYKIAFSSEPACLAQCDVIIVTVPTPINEHNVPDLKMLEDASRTVAAHMKPHTLVVYESSVYPGATEEICVPILESSGTPFKVGYSPERVVPGRNGKSIADIVKLIACPDAEGRKAMWDIYGKICKVHCASSIKVAEASKMMENAQRDVNIAFMNECSILFDRLGIPSAEVLECAKTKWNFAAFSPGLVGGHCIGVDPYYLIHVAKKHQPQIPLWIIPSARWVNERMALVLSCKVVELCNGRGIWPASVAIYGATFKENCSDARNSMVPKLVKELKGWGMKVSVHDPYQGTFSGPEQTDVGLFAVAHDEFKAVDWTTSHHKVFVDIKGMVADYPQAAVYWRL
jgi:UDP-N-acetyl-D-glucosamine/UDP-N-acetyl-D-galactosamine dehydrogenase